MILLNCMITAHATDKEIRHLTQVSFDEYLVQMNWVNECTSSMIIIDKKSHRVIQTISLEGDSDDLYVGAGVVANGNYLQMKDLNKDGHKDLWLQTGAGSEVWSNNVYRFNPKTGTFADLYEHSSFVTKEDGKRGLKTTVKKIDRNNDLFSFHFLAKTTDKKIRHLTQVSFDEYLVQINWVNECTSSMTIIDKKSHRVIQTIPLGDNNLWVDSGVVASGSYLKMKDLDEDGHKDLWLYTNWGTGVHDHNVYRFNPKTETFADRYKHNENDYGKGEWKTTVKKMVDGKWTPVDAIVKERKRAE